MKKAGIVGSRKGVKGGYFIKKPSDKVTIEDIILAIGESVKLVNCLNEKSCLFQKVCPAFPFWLDIEKSIKKKIKKYTLRDLLSGKGANHAKA